MSAGFRCPLCATTIYERVVVHRPDGSYYQTEFFQCAGCSVMFRDADRFTACERLIPGKQYAPPNAAG